MALYQSLQRKRRNDYRRLCAGPLTFAEKGLLQVYFEGPGSSELSLKAGGSLNVVPDHAEYQGTAAEAVASELAKLGYDFQQAGDQITVAGKSVHAKLAPQGVNAITRITLAVLPIQFWIL